MPPLRFRTLPAALFAAPPDKPFVTMWRDEDDVESVTFGEFTRQAVVQSEYLASHGVQSGDTVVLIMPQGVPLMAAFVGAATAALGSPADDVAAPAARPHSRANAKRSKSLSMRSTRPMARTIVTTPGHEAAFEVFPV